eukprot:CAMPEP_0202800650 /NCGR_PEP_ID=MMETSP1388-20130828/100833_1 /ASSEMBLY_ACC=CAM_ASM_000864 /TAXON_ID=37098 /ORGANISM="Isochrysis sp, Strain CCMP1244" /LENGTH=40 /DNA_ID= /DNA_START= /DNA_END= /DNA_ORIENTATION=
MTTPGPRTAASLHRPDAEPTNTAPVPIRLGQPRAVSDNLG